MTVKVALRVCAILLVSSCIASAEYQWPLELPRELSSSFGEYRTGRYHAGIDLRTAGTGRKVLAAESGHVARVRCSPYGYGKAVYLKLNDGNTVIYAHLSAFKGTLTDYVRAAQHSQRRYEVDLFPEAGAFPVQRGDVIAYSGQTGIGVPHLHYEIRDAANRPINPRLLGIDWPDAVRPEIQEVVVAPLSPDARVNGDVIPQIVPVRRTGDGIYTCDPVYARGAVGFGLRVIDPANNGANRLDVYTLETRVDERVLFRLQRDYLSYETLHHGAVAYHPFLLARGRFLLQWRWPGNRSDPYLVFEGDGRYEATGEPLSVHMAATDFHGNESTLNFDVRPDTASNDAPAPTASNGVGQVTLDSHGEFIILTASFDQPESDMPALQVNGANGAPQFFRIDTKTFRAAVAPGPNAQQLNVEVAHPRIEPFANAIEVFHRSAPARSVTIGGLTLDVSSDIPYGVLFAAEDASQVVPRAPGLQTVTEPTSVWPAAAPINGAVTIGISLPPGETRHRQLHIYRTSGDRWTRLSTERDRNRLSASTGAFGTFSVLADEVPPTIGRVAIGSGDSRGSKRPSIRIPIHDHGAGIADYSVMCGSTWLLMAYDPEGDVLDWEQDMDLPSGDQALSIEVTDHAGNVSTSLHPLLVQ